MKLKTLLFTGIFVCIAGAAVAQHSKAERKAAIEEALGYAETVAFTYTDWGAKFTKNYLRNNSLSQQRAFVFYTGDASGLDVSVEQREPLIGTRWVRFASSRVMGHIGLFGGDYVIIAGSYDLLVPRNGGNAEKTKNGITFDVDTLTFNFEAGKYYTIDRRVNEDNKIEFSIGETSPADYSAFQRENPGHIDGTWSGEKRTLNSINTCSMQYNIEGNRMVFEGKNGKKPFVAEGRIMYNENTIIFIPEKGVANGKEIEDFDRQPPYSWYYTLGDGLLLLEGTKKMNFAGARPFNIGMTIWENAGELRKTD